MKWVRQLLEGQYRRIGRFSLLVVLLTGACSNPAVDFLPGGSIDPDASSARSLGLDLAFPNVHGERMTHFAYPDDETNRLFVALQEGTILVFPNEKNANAQVFLDITGRVSNRGHEEGLLGLAFDPHFTQNGYLYVYYSAVSPEFSDSKLDNLIGDQENRKSVVSRFSIDSEDPYRARVETEKILLEVEQPYSNHNGGNLVFGPDDYLYIGLGDGGSRGDPHGHGQNKRSLLGSILRIDVRGLGARDPYLIPQDNPFIGELGTREEIWAYGFRNPWKFTFDRGTGQLWVADVGQDHYEEVNIVRSGNNYGWNLMEGFHCYPNVVVDCDRIGLSNPIVEYSHQEGCSAIGGYVYRGSRIDFLQGAYIYGDWCSGKIWALWTDNSRIPKSQLLIDSSMRISAFGEDRDGELYILSLVGNIYRFSITNRYARMSPE